MDLIGEYPAVVPVDDVGQLGHFLEGEDPAERVVRVAEDEQVPSGAEGVLDRLEVEGEETSILAHPDLNDLAAEEARNGEERHVGGSRQDHRRTGAREMRDGDLERLEHIRDMVDMRGINGPAVAALGELRAGRRQLIGQELRQVAEVGVGRQPGEGVEDGGCRAEVHLRHGGTEAVRPGCRPLEAAASA